MKLIGEDTIKDLFHSATGMDFEQDFFNYPNKVVVLDLEFEDRRKYFLDIMYNNPERFSEELTKVNLIKLNDKIVFLDGNQKYYALHYYYFEEYELFEEWLNILIDKIKNAPRYYIEEAYFLIFKYFPKLLENLKKLLRTEENEWRREYPKEEFYNKVKFLLKNEKLHPFVFEKDIKLLEKIRELGILFVKTTGRADQTEGVCTVFGEFVKNSKVAYEFVIEELYNSFGSDYTADNKTKFELETINKPLKEYNNDFKDDFYMEWYFLESEKDVVGFELSPNSFYFHFDNPTFRVGIDFKDKIDLVLYDDGIVYSSPWF